MQIYMLVSVFLYVQTTIKNLHIRTDMSDQTVQTRIRLLQTAPKGAIRSGFRLFAIPHASLGASPVLQITRGDRDNLGIIIHLPP